jgi:copper homeostasis protein CutC
MSRNPPTPLGRTASEALDELSDPLETNDGLTLDEATEVLTTGDPNTATAQDTIEQLRLRGYLYEVDGQLFLTPTG